MTIIQLSIFLENRSGTLIKVLEVLKKAQIQIIASTIADTAEYGIYRLICSEPQRACDELKQAGVPVSLSGVFALQLDNQPGRAADAIQAFSREGISIAYLYSFLMDDKGILVFRTADEELARETILKNHLPYITEDDLLPRA